MSLVKLNRLTLMIVATCGLAGVVKFYHQSAAGSLMGDHPQSWFLAGMVWGGALAYWWRIGARPNG